MGFTRPRDLIVVAVVAALLAYLLVRLSYQRIPPLPRFAGLAAAYVLFLGFAFHGPSRWAGSQAEFGFFVDHFTFIAGLLFAAVHGPGETLAVKIGILDRR